MAATTAPGRILVPEGLVAQPVRLAQAVGPRERLEPAAGPLAQLGVAAKQAPLEPVAVLLEPAAVRVELAAVPRKPG